MYQRATSLLLRLLKVPHEPQPPHGDPASLQVFRAGRNLFKLKLVGWGVAQVLAFAGIMFWLVIFIDVELEVSARRRATQTPPPGITAEALVMTIDRTGREATSGGGVKGVHKHSSNGFAALKHGLAEIVMRLPWWASPLLWTLKIIGILAYFVQLPVTYLVARLDYELRWYMVTDRSLRIRHGVWKVAESTMSFANIQQVMVSQGPVQRLLGLADVKVQSAGGGSGDEHKKGSDDDLHLGLFHSVTNAPEMRDLILERLRRFRVSGLGDPEEKTQQPPAFAVEANLPAAPDLLAAARELATEARALRVSLN